MTKIGDTEGTIPAIQESDISDKDVINGSSQEAGQDGKVRFVYTLRSGRVITSEWINKDAEMPKLRRMWIEAVKGQEVADASEAADASRRAIRDKQLATPGIDIPVHVNPAPVEQDTPSPATARMADVPAGDPASLVLRNLILAEEALDRAAAGYLQATSTKTAAEAAVIKWRRLLEALKD